MAAIMAYVTKRLQDKMAYELLNPTGRANLILLCEHASNHIPAPYDNLGLDEAQLTSHIAWDIGMGEITRRLSALLDAPALLATFSRLLIDPNREEDHPTLIPTDGIPGNKGLSETEKKRRLEEYYFPFHQNAHELVAPHREKDKAPLICGMHSFTPILNGTVRPHEAGMLWNRDPRLAHGLIKSLEARGINVGDNEPYSGRHLFHTMNIHGAAFGFPHVTIEIRQDGLQNEEGIARWTDILHHDLQKLMGDPELTQTKHF